MYLALGIATVIYVAVALGVFGTLTVDKVIASGGTALAVAAEPVLGAAGYWLMTVTALFATAGATNAGLYPAAGLCEQMVPPASSRPPGPPGRRPGAAGSSSRSAVAIVLAVGFDLTSIASLGSAIALIVFALVTWGTSASARETGASAVCWSADVRRSSVLAFCTSRRWWTSPAPRWPSSSSSCSAVVPGPGLEEEPGPVRRVAPRAGRPGPDALDDLTRRRTVARTPPEAGPAAPCPPSGATRRARRRASTA